MVQPFKRYHKTLGVLFLAAVFLLADRIPSSWAQNNGFAWESVSFDGGINPILAGTVTGTIDGAPVPATQISQLENTGLDFHLRWNSQILAHLGLRFSVGYAAFSPNMGFHGFSALPLTVGATVPLYDPRVGGESVIPYLAVDLGPSFNSLPANQGNVGAVSFTMDAGVGALVPLTPRFSLYGEVLPTMIQGPIAANNPQNHTNVASSAMWTLPVLLGITYNFKSPRRS